MPHLEEFNICFGEPMLVFTPPGLWSLLANIFNALVELPQLRRIRVQVMGCDTFFTEFFECPEGLQRRIVSLFHADNVPKSLEMLLLVCSTAENRRMRLGDKEYKVLYSIFPDLILRGVLRVGDALDNMDIMKMKDKYVEITRAVDRSQS